jgi:preprotein translocase subunit YajC
MLALIAQASNGSNPLVSFLPIVMLGGLFYLFILRPQQRKVKAQQALINSVEVGDEIITTGGIYGTITEIDDDEGTVTVQIAPGAEIRMLRGGIGRLAVNDDGSYDDDGEDDDGYDEDEVEDQPSVSDGSQEYPDQPGQIKEL